MIRSAKMNATTPPKLIPPFQSTTASGTLPTEQHEADDRDQRADERAPDRRSAGVAGEEQPLPERVRDPRADRARDQ